MTGVVTDEVTGLPVQGADVDVLWPIEELQIVTDALGRFEYPGVLLGYNNTPVDRTIFVEAPGYFGGSKPAHLETCGSSAHVGVALRLLPPPIFARLEGRVLDRETGAALPGAEVHGPTCAAPPATTCTTADATGFYSLPAVPLLTSPGGALLFGEHPGYYTAIATPTMRQNETTVHDFGC